MGCCLVLLVIRSVCNLWQSWPWAEQDRSVLESREQGAPWQQKGGKGFFLVWCLTWTVVFQCRSFLLGPFPVWCTSLPQTPPLSGCLRIALWVPTAVCLPPLLCASLIKILCPSRFPSPTNKTNQIQFLLPLVLDIMKKEIKWIYNNVGRIDNSGEMERLFASLNLCY